MATRPVTTVDKSNVLLGLFSVWDAIDALLEGLPESRLAGDDAAAGVVRACRRIPHHRDRVVSAGHRGAQPDIDVKSLEHVRNDIGAMNECWVRHLSSDPGPSVLERYRAVTRKRREVLPAMSDDEWNALTPTPAGMDSYGRFMRIRVFDCWMHEQDIRMALQRPSTDDELVGTAAQLSLDEVAATMGFVVGKLAEAPEGSRVQFDLTGPLARSIRVSVDGRAQVVDDFGGHEPTATIRLDGLQFTRLAGGRPMCPARAQDVELDGDKELADRIVERLNFVI